jgi:hypothetical protein
VIFWPEGQKVIPAKAGIQASNATLGALQKPASGGFFALGKWPDAGFTGLQRFVLKIVIAEE